MMKTEAIRKIAEKIYSPSSADHICRELPNLIARYQYPTQHEAFSQQDAILITYGDMVTQTGEKPLNTLKHFLDCYGRAAINTIHILPFFPYSSDEGFSVIDYQSVNPQLGSWEDIRAIGQDFCLMADLVANHTSVKCGWFRAFLDDDHQYQNYYISLPPDSDTRSVFRPRTSPLLTPFQTASGKKYVWTTFSADQADLNYGEPQVLLEMVDTLLFYVSHSMRFIRLDAIAYIWKELGTPCLHQPQVHHIIQLMRLVLDAVSPGVKLITETNVPHKDNIRYFGDGENEAQLVYNFSLPPLTLHAFHSGSSEVFTRWASSLKTPSPKTAFFNFLASHDGIGITPAHGILPQEEISAMAERVEAAGGYVSYKTNSDGSSSAYEFNINYFDALDNPFEEELTIELKARRFITAHAVMAALQGVPGIYFHSLFGSTSWFEGASKSGMPRTINRKRLVLRELENSLADKHSLRSSIYNGMTDLFSVRRKHAAFHPNAAQTVPMADPAIITIIRGGPENGEMMLCLHNIRARETHIDLRQFSAFTQPNIIPRVIYRNGNVKHTQPDNTLSLSPFESVWLAFRLN